jgi:hypothetical protein
MRYIERTERLMYLIEDAQNGWLVRGVIPGCGSACDVHLAQVVWEFIMSCEGLDADTLQAALRVFIQKNAAAIVEHIRENGPDGNVELLFEQTLRCLLHSLGADFDLQSDRKYLSARFADCPLCGSRHETRIQRHGGLAHEVLFDLVRTTVYKVDPAATVRMPETYSLADHGLDIEIIRPIG